MSKETLQAGLGVRYHSVYRSEDDEVQDAEAARPAREFEPEFHDLERLLPRLRDRQRRM